MRVFFCSCCNEISSCPSYFCDFVDFFRFLQAVSIKHAFAKTATNICHSLQSLLNLLFLLYLLFPLHISGSSSFHQMSFLPRLRK